MLRRITRGQVRLGMFIHGFEGAWMNHPFWKTRFLLSRPADLARVLDSDVPGIVIDEGRGLALGAKGGDPGPPVASGRTGERPGLPPAPLSALRPASFAEERERAAGLVRHGARELARLFATAHAGGEWRLDQFTPLVAEVMASVSRNPYALIAITRLKKRDLYTYTHSLAVSALMAGVARTLGLDEQEVFELGLAGLLHDIGKMVVPDGILQKPDSLTDEELALVRTHPEQGHLLLSRDPAIPAVVLDVCRHHHERLDGTGYPFRLKGDAISRAARIAAICDVYDALTSNRSYKSAWTGQEAIARMSDGTGHFDRGLLFSFMKTIGVYPPGLLVRLRSNRLGVTMPNGRRASRPKVRVFYDSRNRVQVPLEDVVLDDALNHDQIIGEEYPLDWGMVDWPLVAGRLLHGSDPHIYQPRSSAA